MRSKSNLQKTHNATASAFPRFNNMEDQTFILPRLKDAKPPPPPRVYGIITSPKKLKEHYDYIMANAHLEHHNYKHSSPYEPAHFKNQFILQDLETFLRRQQTSTAERMKRKRISRQNVIIDQSHKDHAKNDSKPPSEYDEEEGIEDEELHTDIESEEMETLQEETAEET